MNLYVAAAVHAEVTSQFPAVLTLPWLASFPPQLRHTVEGNRRMLTLKFRVEYFILLYESAGDTAKEVGNRAPA